jgi:hypothetical protein
LLAATCWWLQPIKWMTSALAVELVAAAAAAELGGGLGLAQQQQQQQ